MGQVKNHRRVLLIAALFSSRAEALDWACEDLRGRFGEIRLLSADLDFDQTSFYEAEMGVNLKKRWIAFETLVDPSRLPEIKLQTNQLESACPFHRENHEGRVINIDPGYITEAKLVLATTKDRDHRIYLDRGIYGEITLYYQRDGWKSSRWTYPDYQTHEVIEFVEQCRLLLRSKYQADPAA